LKLSTEERLLFSLSSPDSSPAVSDDIARRLASGDHIDFPKLLGLARRNGVLPFLHKNLKEVYGVPDEIRTILRNAYLMTAGLNTANAMETLEIIDLLKAGGIDAIPLKGSIASEMIFDDPGLYLASDIDLLVKPADLKKAKELLVKEGYLYNEPNERDLLASHYHFILFKKGRHVELHWNLVKRYFEVPPAFWWEGIEIAEYDGKSLPMLSPERCLLYLIFRLFDHGFRPLKFFTLVTEIINKQKGELQWDRLLSLAKRLKMERLVLFVLNLLYDLWNGEIPDEIRRKKIPGNDFLKNLILSGVFREEIRAHLRMLAYLCLLDGPDDIAKAFLGRIFSSPAELRLRYGLPAGAKTIYFYYILNPIFLATRKLTR
jgi:hypothetical protein